MGDCCVFGARREKVFVGAVGAVVPVAGGASVEAIGSGCCEVRVLEMYG